MPPSPNIEELLGQLNEQQREAVLHHGSPLLILAGAGSGKTRVLTSKLVHSLSAHGVLAHEILAMTFSNKAAEEMAKRIDQYLPEVSRGIWMGTFHSIGARILRRHAGELGYGSHFTILDEQDQLQLVRRLLRERGIAESSLQPQTLQGAINRAKNEAVLPEDFVLSDGDDARLPELYTSYQQLLQINNCLDFGDLLVQPLRLFATCPELLTTYRDRFRAFFIDEYQDTNHAQYLLLETLAKGRTLLTVVGDDDQSIYGWRGADVQNILSFPTSFPGTTILKLERNYRSTRHILTAATRVVERIAQRYPKQLYSEREEGQDVRVQRLRDELEEARFVVRDLRDLHQRQGVPRGELAVFYRTNAQSRVFEEELLRNGIPYRIVGGKKFFERMEIKDLLAYLKVLVNPHDDGGLTRIINTPSRGIGTVTLEQLGRLAGQRGVSMFTALSGVATGDLQFPGKSGKLLEFHALLSELRHLYEHEPKRTLLNRLLERTAYLDYLVGSFGLEGESRVDNVREFLNSFNGFFEQHPAMELHDYLETVALFSEGNDQRLSGDEVVLMTVHCSKGLEFDTVYLVGMEEGLFPHARSRTAEQQEEERRLCYVGMTRARQRLCLTFCATRRFQGGVRPAFPSSFVREVQPRPTLPTRSSIPQPPAAFSTAMRHASDDEIPNEYRVGMKVVHPVFGTGDLKNVEGNGHSLRLTVYFVGFGLKKLSPHVMPLGIVN